MRNRCMDGHLKENQEPFQIFLAEIGKKMCTRGIELTNIDLPGAFKW